jgi:GST-like protein
MPQIELYGAKTGNTLRAAIALQEAGIPYVPRYLDLHAGAQRESTYLTLNPAAKVPTLVDHGSAPALILNQSNAIIQYADLKRPGRLSPVDDLNGRLLALDRYFFFVTDVIAPSHAAFFLRQHGKHQASDVIDGQVQRQVAYSESFLTGGFMAGTQFSMADISAFTLINSIKTQLDWTALARLKRWFESIQNRPTVQAGLRAFDAD